MPGKRKLPIEVRLTEVEEMILPIMIEIEMLKLVVSRMLDLDHARCEETGWDPFRFSIEEDLSDEFHETDEPEGGLPWLLYRALSAALSFLASDVPESPTGDAVNDP